MRRVEARRFPVFLVGTAAVLSLVHYADNYLNYDLYPQDPDAAVEVTRDMVWISWLVFFAFAVAAWRLWQRGRIAAACVCLAVFSISGLISLGHYTAPGMSELAAWRHVFIWVDITLGAAILAFAVRAALSGARARPPESAGPSAAGSRRSPATPRS